MTHLRPRDSTLSLPPLRAGAAIGPALPVVRPSTILARGLLVAGALALSALLLRRGGERTELSAGAAQPTVAMRFAAPRLPVRSLMVAATDLPRAH